MTETLRDKLIQKGWVTPFNAATLVRLIEDHYADEPAVPDEGREPAAVTEQPNWRGLCAELLQALEGEGYANWPEGPNGNPLIENARAALARWGQPVPAPPTDGEVAELTGQLIEAANGAAAMGWDQHAKSILRAAELLQRRVLVPEVNNG